MIILPWVKFCYKRLPMGVIKSLYIFQHKMNVLFQWFGFICECINGLLNLTKVNWTDHIEKLELNIYKFKKRSLKCNIKNSFF